MSLRLDTDLLDPRWDRIGPCYCGGCPSCLRAQGYSPCEKCGDLGCDCEQDEDNEREDEE